MAHVPINKGQFTLEPPEREAEFERRRGAGVEAEYAENRRQWREYAEQQSVSDYPVHVDLELASICNLRCPMCYTISDGFRAHVNAKLMDYDLFTKCVDECAANGVYSIRLSFRGEAFLHPRIVDCVRYAKSKGIKEVSSLTNGGRLDTKMFGELMEAGLDWLTISVDGVGEVYDEIRKPLKFDDMVAKLTEFKRLKEAAGRVKPVIKVQSVLPAIEKNPEEYYSIFAPITDMVSANPLIDFHESKEGLPKIPDFSCPQPYQRLVVGADGLCMLCMNDERGQYIIGDANNQSLHEIWHGERMSEARELHRRHQACGKLAPCRECYLPIQVRQDPVAVGERTVVAENYVSGRQRVKDLNTPKRWKREGLDA
jgi:hypothetical protein